MKKFLLPILLLFTIFSCSNNDEDMEQEQDYTSFVVTHEISSYTTKNVVIGYKQEDGIWKRLAAYDVVGSNHSVETIVDFSKAKTVRLFRDYTGNEYKNSANVMFDFELKENRKNLIVIPKITDGSTIVKKDDPTKYPM